MSGATAKTVARYLVGVCSFVMLLLFASGAWGQNTISTVAGSAPPNDVLATAAPIEGPVAIARDAAGNLYVVTDIGVIYKVPGDTPAPFMSIYAGNNLAGFSANLEAWIQFLQSLVGPECVRRVKLQCIGGPQSFDSSGNTDI